ncbi:hypothetical protein Bca4012_000355 [Brassica carinata]
MDEYSSMKAAAEGKKLAPNVLFSNSAEMAQKRRHWHLMELTWEGGMSEGVSVRGYDNSLPSNDIKSALTKHFASCGEITDVFVLKRRAIIYFFGWHAISKAVELVVKALPVPKRNLGLLHLVFLLAIYYPS